VKFSPQGILRSEAQPYSSLGWDWLTDRVAIGYGAFDTPNVGLFTFDYSTQQLTRLGNFDALQQRGIYADGHGHWLANLATGPLTEDGQRWADADRLAAGMSPEGKRIFIQKPGFNGFIVRPLDGPEMPYGAPAIRPGTITMKGGVLLYQSGISLRAFGAADPFAPPCADVTFAVDAAGARWLAGYVAGWGLCAWPWGSGPGCFGRCLSTDGRDYYPDLDRSTGVLRVASAEYADNSGLRLYEFSADLTMARRNGGEWFTTPLVDLFQPPAAVPTVPALNHRISIVPFKDPQGDTHADAEVVVNRAAQQRERPCWVAEDSVDCAKGQILGIYTEASTRAALARAIGVAQSLHVRVAFCHDGTDLDRELVAHLRPCDQVWLECYRTKAETLAQSIARWSSNLAQLRTVWSSAIGLIPQEYNQGGIGADEVWTTQESLEACAAVPTLANSCPQVVTIAPFEYLRANGIIAHPALRIWLDALIAATPGVPELAPIDPPPPPPNPVHPPVPVFPPPASPLSGGTMKYALRDDTPDSPTYGMFARVEANPEQSAFGSLFFDRASLDEVHGHETVRCDEAPDQKGYGLVVFVAAETAGATSRLSVRSDGARFAKNEAGHDEKFVAFKIPQTGEIRLEARHYQDDSRVVGLFTLVPLS